jgi:hypothetical protein
MDFLFNHPITRGHNSRGRNLSVIGLDPFPDERPAPAVGARRRGSSTNNNTPLIVP